MSQESGDRSPTSADTNSNTNRRRAKERPPGELLLPSRSQGEVTASLHFIPVWHFPGSVGIFSSVGKKASVFLLQGDIGAPGAAGPKGEKVIYH